MARTADAADPAGEGGRAWGGRTAQERAAARHAAFLEAGLELYGTRPADDVGVAELVAAAGQTRRAFYELFAGREDLLRQVDERVGRGALATAVAAAGGASSWPAAQRVVRETLAYYQADPRRINVAFVTVVGVSRAMEEHRRRQIDALAEGIAALLGDRAGPDAPARRLAGHAVAGAMGALLTDWTTRPGADMAAIERELLALLRARFYPDAPEPQ